MEGEMGPRVLSDGVIDPGFGEKGYVLWSKEMIWQRWIRRCLWGDGRKGVSWAGAKLGGKKYPRQAEKPEVMEGWEGPWPLLDWPLLSPPPVGAAALRQQNLSCSREFSASAHWKKGLEDNPEFSL